MRQNLLWRSQWWIKLIECGFGQHRGGGREEFTDCYSRRTEVTTDRKIKQSEEDACKQWVLRKGRHCSFRKGKGGDSAVLFSFSWLRFPTGQSREMGLRKAGWLSPQLLSQFPEVFSIADSCFPNSALLPASELSLSGSTPPASTHSWRSWVAAKASEEWSRWGCLLGPVAELVWDALQHKRASFRDGITFSIPPF